MFEYWKTYFSVLGKRKTVLPAIMALFLLSSMLDLIGIGLVGPYIALLQTPDVNPDNRLLAFFTRLLGGPISSSIYFVGMGILLAFVLKGIFAVLIHGVIIRFSYEHQRSLRTRLMSAYQSMPFSFHLQTSSSTLINAVNNHTTVYASSTLVASLRLMAELVVCITIGVLLVATDATAAVLICSILLTVLFVVYFLTKKIIANLGRRLADTMGELLKSVSEGLGGLKEVKILGREAFFLKRVDDAAMRYADAGTKYYSLQIVPRYLIEIVIVGFFVAFTSLKISEQGHGPAALSTLGVFAVAALRMIPSFTVIMASVNNMKMSTPILYDLAADLRETAKSSARGLAELPLRVESAEPRAPDPLKDVEIKDIWFTYPGSEVASLKGITLSFERGQSVGLMGRSGAGKTTLADLLLGFVQPNSGTIMRNGRSIHEDIHGWRQEVAYIPQDIFITDDTLRRNIALGVEDCDIDSELLQGAIKLAQLEDVVSRLERGVDTRLGESGVKLSGGQKQRVALARAFYHRREIVVMDEATSALDTETEDAVVAAIAALKGSVTLIVIAHRLTTLRHCDMIIKLEDGKVVAVGEYSEVIQ